MELTVIPEPNQPPPPTLSAVGSIDADEVWAQVAVIVRRTDRLRAQVAQAAIVHGAEWPELASGLASACRGLRAILAAVPVATAMEGARRMVDIGELRVCRDSRSVWVAGRPLDLPPKVFGLLEQLAADPLRVFTKQELLRSVWDWRGSVTKTRTLDTQASRLRRALREADPGGRAWVVNRWGVGYALLAADEHEAAVVPAVAA